MSQLIFVVIGVLLSFHVQAQPVSDSMVLQKLSGLEQSLHAERSLVQKIKMTEDFKDFMSRYLESYRIERTTEGKKEFAALNELYVSFLTIRVNADQKMKTCRESAQQIRKEGLLPEEKNLISPSAQTTLKILKLLCD